MSLCLLTFYFQNSICKAANSSTTSSTGRETACAHKRRAGKSQKLASIKQFIGVFHITYPYGSAK
jgi:hypothetical protein